MYLGIDVGSISVKTALIDTNSSLENIQQGTSLRGAKTPKQSKDEIPCGVYPTNGGSRNDTRLSEHLCSTLHSVRILDLNYVRHKGEPLKTVGILLEDLARKFSLDRLKAVGVTGCGGELLKDLLKIEFVNEIVSQAAAVNYFYPNVKTIIEIGGQDSKLILLSPHGIQDFSMNTICAAGTGSFLDQQASRLKMSIEEFGKIALKSNSPPRIAGRCSVFAKSDMIHLQQKGALVEDIVAGLCLALARNFKSNIARSRNLPKPIVFSGGVAANPGMVRAFKEVFEESELIVPEYHAVLGALGVALVLLREGIRDNFSNRVDMMSRLKDLYRNLTLNDKPTVEPTGRLKKLSYKSENNDLTQQLKVVSKDRIITAYLGVDVGSISTNIVVMDENKNILSKRYLMTQGRPIEVVRSGLEDIGREVKDRVIIKGVCTTGSGRYMIADLIGADLVKNEITAQARAAIEIDPTVDTVFEIGGQDSKFISIEEGRVIDFEMNKVCAAGTGSFLEEQSERLGIDIKDFGDLALSSSSPVRLGERCTVFMETDLVSHQQKGANREDLASGLAYSIVYNYLNRVVGKKRIGNNIFFQGGVAFNKSVVAAFEQVTGKKITVPPDHEVTGAIGCCLLAQENSNVVGNGGGISVSKFKGFEIATKNYSVSSFECNGCANQCEINKVSVDGELPLFYGSRCEKYELRKKSTIEPTAQLPDLFAHRKELQGFQNKFGMTKSTNKPSCYGNPLGKLGIPRALSTYELYPFFNTFFSEIGFEVVLSDETNKKIIHQGIEFVPAETCYPVKIIFGHICNLIEKGVQNIFLPSIINLSGYGRSYVCPYVQTIPYTAKTVFDFDKLKIQLISPVLEFAESKKYIVSTLTELAKKFTKDKNKIDKAIQSAFSSQEYFYTNAKEKGKEILSSLNEGIYEKALVIIGRPYNTCDDGINLRVHKKLLDLGVLPIPMDYLPTESTDTTKLGKGVGEGGGALDNMYWRFGQKVLAAAEFVREHPKLYAVYLTNFGCGPDSFILHFFNKKSSGKPFLQIEIDEHSADAGIITRCEAFLDSIRNNTKCHPSRFLSDRDRYVWTGQNDRVYKSISIKQVPLDNKKRKIYLPRMSEHAYPIAAAFNSCGLDAEVLEESDEKTIQLGREYTSGKECYPCIITTGDMIKKVLGPEFNPDKAAFFMPSASGPCRFGQYNMLHRIILDELGFKNVPILAPKQDTNFYKELGWVAKDLAKLGWEGIVATDLLDKAKFQVRPYELQKGNTEEIYNKYLQEICNAILARKNLVDVLQKAMKEFKDIPVKDINLPKVGLVGEIFIRSNRFSNNDLIRELEELGCEVYLSPMAEWLLYTNVIRKMEAKKIFDLINLVKYFIIGKVQKHIEHKFNAVFEDFLRNLNEPEIKQIFENASPYLHYSFRGEAILSIGKAIDFIKKGCSGIVAVMPFTCMPGTIVAAILKSIKKDFNNIPVLNIAYDGLEEATTRIRLEAFAYQVKQYHLSQL
ncbi:MAG: acyl-CoA dehydratase activase [Elusimicrobiota bacterium]|nr:acyl-CoA dehydratase activase [Elusimicrobiota bacterium]